jgi:hypothetical protein
MANGSVALHVAIAPAQDAPVEATSKPGACPAAPEITIGVAVASAVEALVQMLIDVDGGAPLRAEIRTLGGDRLAMVVEHLLAHLDEVDNWRDHAQQEGVRLLHERYGAALRQHLDTDVSGATIDAALNELCALVITAAVQVSAIELAMRAN